MSANNAKKKVGGVTSISHKKKVSVQKNTLDRYFQPHKNKTSIDLNENGFITTEELSNKETRKEEIKKDEIQNGGIENEKIKRDDGRAENKEVKKDKGLEPGEFKNYDVGIDNEKSKTDDGGMKNKEMQINDKEVKITEIKITSETVSSNTEGDLLNTHSPERKPVQVFDLRVDGTLESNNEMDESGFDPSRFPGKKEFVKIQTNSSCLCYVADLPDSFFSINRKRKLDEYLPNACSSDECYKHLKKNQSNINDNNAFAQAIEDEEKSLPKACNSDIKDEVSITIVDPNQSRSSEESANLSNADLNDTVTLTLIQPEEGKTIDPNQNLVKSETAEDNQNVQVMVSSAEPKPDKIFTETLPNQGSWTDKKVFENSVHQIINEEFDNMYSKLGLENIPICIDRQVCEKEHKNTIISETSVALHTPLYITLDAKINPWDYDMINTALSLIRPDLHLSSDVLRILFDYLLRGPCLDQAIEVQIVLATHFNTHTTCSTQMKTFYTDLLTLHNLDESYFKTELADSGIFYFVMDELEKHVYSKYGKFDSNPPQPVTQGKKGTKKSSVDRTFKKMEKKWNNFKPLFDDEEEKVISLIDGMSGGPYILEEIRPLTTSQRLERLNMALELITNLLTADFVICVAKLKEWMKDQNVEKFEQPLVSRMVDVSVQDKIFSLYASTSNQSTWMLLNKMIGLMAEQLHLFPADRPKFWKYPDLNQECIELSSRFFNAIKYCRWSDYEKLKRLHMVKPPWLQQQITMMFVNAELKLEMGNNLESIVSILRLNTDSTAEMKHIDSNRLKMKRVSNQNHANSSRAASSQGHQTGNQFGETLLHEICKVKETDASLIESVLSASDDVNAQDNFGWTPLHMTVAKGSVENLKVLLDYQPSRGQSKINLDAKTFDGDTPLHHAVHVGDLEKCKALVELGGSILIFAPNNRGETPFKTSKHNQEIYQYFKQAMKTEELLNCTLNPKLNLKPHVIKMLDLASTASFDDYNTHKLVDNLRQGKNINVKKEHFIVVDRTCLLAYKKQVKLFCRLNKALARLNDSHFYTLETEQWHSKLCV